MMNKKSLALLSAFVASVLSVSAQTTATAPVPVAPAAPAVSVVLTPSLVSQYMFRGQRLGGLSFEPSVEVDYDNIALGVWSNFPVESKVVGVSDPEFDFYGSYTTTINAQSSVVLGFTYYYYPSAFTNAGSYRSTFEPSIAFNYTVAGIKLTPKVYYDFVLDGPTYELTAAYALPLKEIGTELDFTATGGTYIIRDALKDSSPKAKAWGDYWLVGVSAPYQLTKDSKLSIGVAYTKGSDAFVKVTGTPRTPNTAAVGRGVVTLSYAYTF
jgi:uncharacterized protein (TIGR02001 family)